MQWLPLDLSIGHDTSFGDKRCKAHSHAWPWYVLWLTVVVPHHLLGLANRSPSSGIRCQKTDEAKHAGIQVITNNTCSNIDIEFLLVYRLDYAVSSFFCPPGNAVKIMLSLFKPASSVKSTDETRDRFTFCLTKHREKASRAGKSAAIRICTRCKCTAVTH